MSLALGQVGRDPPRSAGEDPWAGGRVPSACPGPQTGVGLGRTGPIKWSLEADLLLSRIPVLQMAMVAAMREAVQRVRGGGRDGRGWTSELWAVTLSQVTWKSQTTSSVSQPVVSVWTVVQKVLPQKRPPLAQVAISAHMGGRV